LSLALYITVFMILFS